MERLATVQIEPEDLLKEMGAEAYYAAVQLGEEVMARHHRDTIYWQIYEEMGATFAPQIDAGRAALVKAYEKIAEANEKAEIFQQKTLKAEQIIAKVQKTVEETKRRSAKRQKQNIGTKAIGKRYFFRTHCRSLRPLCATSSRMDKNI